MDNQLGILKYDLKRYNEYTVKVSIGLEQLTILISTRRELVYISVAIHTPLMSVEQHTSTGM